MKKRLFRIYPGTEVPKSDKTSKRDNKATTIPTVRKTKELPRGKSETRATLLEFVSSLSIKTLLADYRRWRTDYLRKVTPKSHTHTHKRIIKQTEHTQIMNIKEITK